MRGPPLPPWRGWLWILGGAYIAALVLSACYGTPHRLPGIALGLPVLLHAERAAALVAVIAAVLIVAYLTSLGYLPTQLGNIGYGDLGGRQHELEQQVASLASSLEGRLDLLEDGAGGTEKALRLIAQQLEAGPEDR